MKKQKLIIGIIVGIVVLILGTLLTVVIVNNKNEQKKFEESDYISQGQYFEKFIEEYQLYSTEYSDDDIYNDDDYSVVATIMYEWGLITKKQTKNTYEPLTKELVAQTVVNNMTSRQTHDVKVEDISRCYDKQAIIDAVGMGIFELENGKFNPNDYMTYKDVEDVFEKAINIDSNAHYSEDEEWENVKIVINKEEYQITNNMKVLDFINAGWTVTGNREILSQTVEQIEQIISNSDILYIDYNLVSLEQENLSLILYFDMSEPNTKVINSKVIAIGLYEKDESATTDVDFYGLKFGQVMTKKDYAKIFGKENFVMYSYGTSNIYQKSIKLSDDSEINIQLSTDIETNELYGIEISM